MIGYFLKSSCGNDSVALIQWAKDARLRNVHVIYSDTGWASPDWERRIQTVEVICGLYGFEFSRIASMGFRALVKKKQSFPRQGIQFCTEELKIKPSQAFMDTIDPDRQYSVLVGKRREESANRKDTPEFVAASDIDMGRHLWHPLFNKLEVERDALIAKTGMKILTHRSKECFPCVNSNRADILNLAKSPDRITEIAVLENEMGITSNGKPRTFFRPYRYMGATGINEVVRWAEAGYGKFSLDDGTGNECHSGVCGI